MLPALLATAPLVLMAAAQAEEPVLYDDGLVLETYASGFCCRLTGMEFVGGGDMLVLQKNGNVMLVRDGQLRPDPVLVVETTPVREMGLLGIAATGEFVYLYYTVPDNSGNPLSNRIERYAWDGQSLTDPVAIMELPANTYHNGGAMVAGPDGQIYAVIGDTGRYGPLQNKQLQDIYPPGTLDYMDTSVILRVDPPGPYLAVGIRNSFGLAIDPATGMMWATENGDDDSDEINLIRDGFNSGWQAVMGPATDETLARLVGYEGYEYGDPKFTWYNTVAPTGITFGSFAQTDAYDDSVFVGDCNHGRLYMFKLNPERDGFEFSSPGLWDTVADGDDTLDEIIVGEGLGCITNIRTGPDGYVYVASYSHDAVYRILPAAGPAPQSGEQVSQPDGSGGCLIATAAYGTELAPQVQRLREIRDTKILPTEAGAAFMSAFNALYYTFSPAVADIERENPAVRNMIKIAITPMIYSLLLMDLAGGNTGYDTILLGSAVLLLNVAMYVVIPVAVIHNIRKRRRRPLTG